VALESGVVGVTDDARLTEDADAVATKEPGAATRRSF
jgi:hypothetical protein